MEKIRDFWYRLTNNMSLNSMFAILISATLVVCGLLFWRQKADSDLLFSYMSSSAGLMVIYAIAYGNYALTSSEFDGGLISARQVIRFIAVSTCLALLACGVQLKPLSALGWSVKDSCLIAGPAITTLFAVTYGYYVNIVVQDRKAQPSLSPDRNKRGPGRNTIKLLKFASCGSLLWCAMQAGLALQPYNILTYLIALVGCLFFCTVVEVFFAKTVPLSNDRGLRETS